ncbi:MAG TPA: glycosyltransferase family 39 protein, partial [Acidobacteriota bacterium]
LAGAPQHVEFCHMLRPEIPAIFFVLLAVNAAHSILRSPEQRDYWLFGIAAGISFSIKYTVGAPLMITLLLAHVAKRNDADSRWFLRAILSFFLVFIATNPFLLRQTEAPVYWMSRLSELSRPGEDYYGKNIFFYYLEFLTRYDYNLPLMILAGLGSALSIAENFPRGIVLVSYPVLVFFWLCSFETRRVHGLLPLHPFIALWAAISLNRIWDYTLHFSRAWIFKLAYGMLVCAVLFWPYYRTGVQAYLFSKTDNRSKAELWMTNRLPRGSKVAILQFQQIELAPEHFEIHNFAPADYVPQNKDFAWFQANGFDYIAVSSGQYMRYFTEGDKAKKYRDYFLKLFADGNEKGTCVLDLVTHPLLIPDYRLKVFSTRRQHSPPQFLPAIESRIDSNDFDLMQSDTVLDLSPGYYSLEFFPEDANSASMTVRNLKLQEVILHKHNKGRNLEGETYFPFAIFPVKESSKFALLGPKLSSPEENQPIQFRWSSMQKSPELNRIQPVIEAVAVEFSPVQIGSESVPFLRFNRQETFRLHCRLRNRSIRKVAGYVEAFLSPIGEAQPWKKFELASGMQEFFLEPEQRIKIDIPMTTGTLTGDHQLSYWIFTRQDLPYSPQNGGWFNKQIRVNDARLGIHPVYGVPIP